MFTMGGPITSATPGVRSTATDNLALLVAIARALTWAAEHPAANPIQPMGSAPRAICIRYESEYAAMIASGGWKAKKHKGVAEVAGRAWKRLKAQRGERLYLAHAPRAHPRDGLWMAEAAGLAKAGKCGTYTYAEDVN